VNVLEGGVAAAAGWDASAGAAAQTVRLEETSRAQLTADQTQLSLLMGEPARPAVDGKTAVKAYGGSM
jgi:hypothetical protein